MDDIHPIKDFTDPLLPLAPELWAMAGVVLIVAMLIWSHALSRWRAPALSAPDVVPLQDIRAEAMARLSAVSLESHDFAERTHVETRRYLDLADRRTLYSARTGREMTAMLDDDRVRKFEEMYTASQYAEAPLDHESRRRFRRLAEDIVLGIG